jgi:hypothetical protein
MSLARIAGWDWLWPTWWRYWGGGSPLEYTYAPLIPAAVGVIMRVLHCAPPLALNALTTVIYSAGPVVFYPVSWRLSRRPGYSFAAALIWSLLSPVALLIPDFGFQPGLIGSGRRLYLTFEWDDLPHLTSLTIAPLAVWTLASALKSSRLIQYGLAALAMSAMMLANMFGVVLVALLVITIPFALEDRFQPSLFLRCALTAAGAWIVASPWVSPSLLATIRRNEAGNGETSGTVNAMLALGIVALSFWAVGRFAGRYKDHWPARWMLLAGCIVILIPGLAGYSGLSFVPQPGRYKIEAELAIVWIAVFALRPIIDRIPARIRVALLLPILFVAGLQISAFRHTADLLNGGEDVNQRVEYRAAQWVARNLPGQRVLLGGSLGNFANLFSDLEQLSAQPYTTALNWEEQIGLYTIYRDENTQDRGAEFSLLWLKAFGVHAVAVPGPNSHEYWKPFAHPKKFEGVLPVLWRDDDVTIYRVPQSSASLAHVIRLDQLVCNRPVHGLDTVELRRFVAALDASSPARFQWSGSNHAVIGARLAPGEIVSTQINYHRGWHAVANGGRASVRPDGLNLMTIEPKCIGECEIELEYDGGWELRLSRVLSVAALLVFTGVVLVRTLR